MGHTTRSDDEAVLAMLRLRRTTPTPIIGAKFRMTSAAVRVATDRVLKADCEHEGRDLRCEYGFLGYGPAIKIMKARSRR